MLEDISDSGGNMARALILRGNAYRHLGRLPEAADSFEQSLQLDLPQDSRGRAHKSLGEIYRDLGDSLSAEEHFSIVDKMVADLFERSSAELRGQRPRNAAAAMELASELISDEFLKAQAHQQLVSIYYGLGETELAEQHQNAIQRLAEQSSS